MKVSSVNSSGRALPEDAGAEAVADATGVSAATLVAAADVTAGTEAAALEATGVSSAAAEVATADERTAVAEAVGVAIAVPLETAEVAGVELPEPPQVAMGPPGAV